VKDTLVVRPLGGDRYAVQVRGHELLVDQPTDAGGTDIGPTPVELFAASLASCVAHYAGGFLARHGVCRDGLRVDMSWQMSAGRPARVASVALLMTPPPALPRERLPALLAVARACTVHNSLDRAPDVSIEVAPGVADKLRACATGPPTTGHSSPVLRVREQTRGSSALAPEPVERECGGERREA
jgi:uncharacterized OsmC-like protein